MITATETKLPRLKTALPGPNARRVIESDSQYMSPSSTRDYPLVAKRGHGAIVEDPDGNSFLDFAAGIAVCSTGHCHPKVVACDPATSRRTDPHVRHGFLSRHMPLLAERLVATIAGDAPSKSILRQFRRRSRRSRHQAGALRHAPRQNDRLLRLFPRAHHRRALADRLEKHAAQGFRHFALRHRTHSVSLFLPLRARPHRGNLRRGNHRTARAANFQAPF